MTMAKLEKKFYKACEDFAKGNTYNVERMTQKQFDQAVEQMLKSCWVFVKKNFRNSDILKVKK